MLNIQETQKRSLLPIYGCSDRFLTRVMCLAKFKNKYEL